MAVKLFEFSMSDEEMRAQLERGGGFLVKSANWQAVERQVDRLGFGERYFVAQVCSGRGKLTKVTPNESGRDGRLSKAA